MLICSWDTCCLEMIFHDTTECHSSVSVTVDSALFVRHHRWWQRALLCQQPKNRWRNRRCLGKESWCAGGKNRDEQFCASSWWIAGGIERRLGSESWCVGGNDGDEFVRKTPAPILRARHLQNWVRPHLVCCSVLQYVAVGVAVYSSGCCSVLQWVTERLNVLQSGRRRKSRCEALLYTHKRHLHAKRDLCVRHKRDVCTCVIGVSSKSGNTFSQ